jgi:hypothetical protein
MSNKNGKQIAKKLILKQYVTQYHWYCAEYQVEAARKR